MVQLTCSLCKKVFTGEEWELVALELAEHAKGCAGQAAPIPIKHISDVVPKEALEGNFTTIDEILGKLVLVKDFTFKESTFKEDTHYLSMTLEVDGEEKILNTGATRVTSAFQALDPALLPIYATFEKIILAGGRRVYRVK